MSGSTILIVEDEAPIREIIKNYIEKSGYRSLEAEDGMEALTLIKTQAVDLVILDIMLPHIDGFSVCRIIREEFSIPIIILTAKNKESEKLRGYDLGADDYITKPFSIRVLMAKIKALIRRAADSDYRINEIKGGNIICNSETRTVKVSGEEIDFTYKEYELLRILMENPGKVFSREELINRIWGYEYAGNTRTVDTHIKRIRAKLGEEARHIITLIRSGYKFEVSK